MPKPAGRINAARATGIAVSLLAALVYALCIAGRPGIFAAVDSRIADAMFRWRGQETTSGRVVIVDVDERSLAALGQWPWPRTVLAGLVERIAAAGAAVIAFDMVFAEPDRTSPATLLRQLDTRLDEDLRRRLRTATEDLDNDRTFGDAVATAPVVLGYVFRTEGDVNPRAPAPFPSITLRVEPDTVAFGDLDLPQARDVIANLPAIAQAPSEGFLNFFPDPTGTVRTAPLFLRLGDVPYPSMPMEAYRIAAGVTETVLVAASQQRGEQRTLLGIEAGGFLPTDPGGRLVINFRGPAHSFPYLSAADVLHGSAAEDLGGKVVLIGTSAAGLLDLRATPFTSVCPGVEVNATIIDNLLQKDPLRHDAYTEAGLAYALILGGGLLVSLLLTSALPLAGSVAGFLLLPAVIALDYHLLFLRHHLQVGISYPMTALVGVLLLVTFVNYLTEGRQKRFIQSAFSRYVSPQVVSRLVRDPSLLTLAGEERRITVFFSDIRDFTTLSEQMTPQQLGRFMNEYLTAMSGIVLAHGGTVDKFIGDAVMALWGAPADDELDAVHAVRAALAMEAELNRLRPLWLAAGYPEIHIGAGINSGPAYVGNFGSQQRFDYTAIGDHVNLASRLEGANKTYGTTVIVSEFTRELLGGNFFLRQLDQVRMKGKTRSVRIFEPLCEGEPDEPLRAETEDYEGALAAYRGRRFAVALARFEGLAARRDHPLYRLYADRCRRHLAAPPPPDWDGVHTFTSK
ncbi:MAG: adenylate/guanylate cyclase domain-containing protein [Thermodesulfobacteriota bacterium]